MKVELAGSDRYQQQVIMELGKKNILVSASAGAGKTKVLVTRIMKRIVEDHVDLERIVALTFTAAAAEEMKNRLAAELHAMRARTENAEEQAYLEKQITSLVNAEITTIDSYCLNIIKKYYNVIGLDPAVTGNILSEGKNELLQRQAFEAALQEMHADDPDGLLRLTVWFSQRSEDFDTLYEIIDTVRRHADAAADPDSWYEQAAAMYVPFTSLKQLPAAVKDTWFAMLEEKCRDISTALQNGLERLAFLDGDDKITEPMLYGVLNPVKDAMRLAQEQDYEGFRVKLQEAAEVKIANSKDPQMVRCRDIVFARIDELLAICYPQEVFASRSGRQAEIAALLIRLARLVSAHFERRKKEEACLNYSDMERYALNILRANDNTIARRISSGIDEILVDEFQDTSILQDTIISLAAGDKMIFRVGDVKQSIYRFRQARPQLMRDLIMDQESIKAFNLRYNYRSSHQIIRFTNLLFERLMNIDGTLDSYQDEDHVTAGLDRQKTAEDARVELVLLEKPEPEVTAKGKRKALKASEARYMKSAWIASRIHEMMTEDPSLSYHDFAVLTRSHGEQIALRSQFDRFHIPYDIDAREGFYRSDLCRDILVMLRYMQDLDDVLSLLSVLTSPMYRFSDEQIAGMVLAIGRKLTEAVRMRHPEIPERFACFNQTAKRSGPLFLLQQIMTADAGGKPFYEVLTRKDQANFDYLFDKVTSSGILTVSELIDEIDAGSDEKSSEAVTSGKDDDVVTVTTIHHSKGLQYKIVFLWGTSANRHKSQAAGVIVDDVLGLGFKDVDPETRIILPTVQRLAVEWRDDKEDLEEYNRLLYVAVTRAEERLIIVDDAAAAQDTQPHMDLSVLADRKGITGLITAALDHEPGINENGLFKVSTVVFDEDELIKGDQEENLQEAVSLLRWTGPAVTLPEILTPSSLEKASTARDTYTLPPLSETGRGASYGTLVHELMAALPDDREWTIELLRQYADPSLPESTLLSVRNFYESDLYQTAKNMEIHKEYPFYYEDDQIRINGIMDFAAIGKYEIILIDFKTDRASEEEIREMYAPQLNTYRMVLQHFFPGHSVTAYAWSFHNDKAIQIS
ncbi:MAG: UvrD-helicase domain-containing protein [Solobacterium sp.]|nr:UvrD-helicase domain-containing protein [Solobacterium sp.]